ncbi:multidrug efflux pump subunit AcrB [Runella defluvii]|uniref:Multidrug efflux pump subunit AcrB n=1 Tax=Runella defluvii TaxID=370973 RepID=A0A7W5ZKD4_9BACT|nr:efflux RND transporter permease subunit [Runella defluvii]MBB3837371.1 multidrug efflux pump subunit AcrB [Runella defluvii]
MTTLKDFKVTRWCLENKTTVYLFTAIISLAGLFVYFTMPKEQFPEIAVPTVIVSTIYPGASPSDIETVITKPIEKQIKAASGVTKIKSNSIQDFSLITVEFSTGIKAQEAKQRVADAVDKALVDLPSDRKQDPSVQEVNFSEFPIMNINLAGNYSLKKLKDYAEQLKDEIESLPEITRVDIVGALDREIQINLDLYKMQAAGVSFYEIQNAIQGENINVSGGELNVDNVRRNLRVVGEFKDVRQLENIIVRSSTGATLRLAEIAEVKDGFAEKQSYASLDGKTVITLNVIKRGGENLISAADEIKAILKKYEETKFPDGLKVSLTNDSSERTKVELNDLLNTVILGFIFVVLVLMFFMGVQDAIFVGLSVPLSTLVAFVLFPVIASATGITFTLNTIVLFAFLLGLGIVVDDAIVVIENAHRVYNDDKKLTRTEAISYAAGEVFIPVLSGTLTTIAPFLPLLFWPGIVGEFMKFLPLTLIITLFASLFVAYVMNPVFAASSLKRVEEHANEDKSFKSIRTPLFVLLGLAAVGYLINFGIGNLLLFIAILYVFNHYILTPKIIVPFQENVFPRLKNGYRKVIAWVITGRRPYGVFAGVIGILVGTFVLMGAFPPKSVFFPSGDPDFVYVYCVMPQGTDASKTNEVMKQLEDRVYSVIGKNSPAVASVITNVGINAGDPFNPDRTVVPHKGKITVAFKSVEERLHHGVSTSDILAKVREKVKGIPGAQVTAEPESNGPPTGKPVTIEIAGEDFGQLVEVTAKVKNAIVKSGIQGIEELKSDLVLNKPEIVIDINREQAAREGISTAQIALQIRGALFGTEVSKFRDDKDDYPIMVRLKEGDRNQIEKLLSMNVVYRDMNLGGVLRQVPLSTLTNIRYATTYSGINRKDQERVVTLSSDVLGGFNANEVNVQVQEVVDGLDLPQGYTIRLGGEQEEQMKSMQFLGAAFLGAILLIFLILVTQFNSTSKPLIIFFTVLFSLIGVFLGFMLTGKTMSIIMTGVGIFALAGIVIKNGILLIEFTDELKTRGYPTRQALIEAGAARLTPVLLTASACILGLIPLALGMNINFVTLFTEFNPQIFIGGFSALFWGPLAYTIIYGLLFSTTLTLIVVPTMYWIVERLKFRLGKKSAAEAVYVFNNGTSNGNGHHVEEEVEH